MTLRGKLRIMNNQTAIKALKLFTDEVLIESLKDARLSDRQAIR